MWRKLSERVVHDGYRRVAVRTFETPAGVEELEIMLEPDTAAVLALTSEREVLLVREFRPGPEAWLLELPGGVVDPGENPVEAARRELLEETGYDGAARPVGSAPASAYSTRSCHVCVVEDARKIAESSEGLEVVLLSLPEFREHLRSGLLTDVGAGYTGLDALGLL